MEDMAIAGHSDAELILRLYDLRREAEMRRARDWFAQEFWPKTVEDLQKITFAFGSKENAWFRQVTSYWDMAAAFVNRGALDAGLFYDTCGEAYFVYTKIKRFLPQMRVVVSAPEFLMNLERTIEGSAAGRERVARMEQNFERFAERIAANKG